MAYEALKIELAKTTFHLEDAETLEQIRRLLADAQQAAQPKPRAFAGWGKGLVGELPADFDEPLDDLKEHMY